MSNAPRTQSATLDDLHALDHVKRLSNGLWWERWTDEDGATRWQIIGNDTQALTWLNFWRSVK